MKELNIFNFKSKPRNNHFAPEWSYFLCEKIINDIDCKKLSAFLLAKEKEILKIKPKIMSDGCTGLGDNTVSGKFSEYNVLKFNNKEINKLKHKIIETHNQFIKALNIPMPNSLYAQCWYNILRKGQEIKAHAHGFDPDTYLGGHFCVQIKDTSTYYMNSINHLNHPEIFKSENKIGKLTLFQNFIPHYTDKNNSNLKRITIAFDLSLIKRNNNYYKLF